MIVIEDFSILKCFARNFINSALAFPFSGGAATRIFIVPSAMVSTISDFGLLGITFIRK